MATDFYWEDIQQAQQRLSGTVVQYDGRPVFITNIASVDTDNTPRAFIKELPLEDNGDLYEPINTKRKKLNSPKFNKFRDPMPLGFVNYFPANKNITHCSYLQRIPVRIQQHGLNDRNILVQSLYAAGVWDQSNIRFTKLLYDDCILDLVEDNYPSFEECYANLSQNSSVAISRKYCLFRDDSNLTWFYRDKLRVGLCLSDKGLFLLKQFTYLREELQESGKINTDYIKEL